MAAARQREVSGSLAAALLCCRHHRSLCAAATALPCASHSGEYAVLSALSVLSRDDFSKFMQWEYSP